MARVIGVLYLCSVKFVRALKQFPGILMLFVGVLSPIMLPCYLTVKLLRTDALATGER